MIKLSVFLLLITTVLLGDLKFGYVPGGINEFVMTQYKKDIFSEYFNKKTNNKIIIIKYRSYKLLKVALKSKNVDFAIIANYQYRNFKNDIIPIVNISKTGHRLSSYLLLVNNTSNIKNISELNDKVLACSGKIGNISFLSSVIKKNPKDLFSKILKENNPSKLLNRVVSNNADLTCVNEGMYNSIIRYRPNYKSKLKVLYRSKEYASDLIVASKKFSNASINKMKSLFLNMKKDPEGSQVLISLKLSRFFNPITDESKYPTLRLYKEEGKLSNTKTKEKVFVKSGKGVKLNKKNKKKSYNNSENKKKFSNKPESNSNLKYDELERIKLQNENLQKELKKKELEKEKNDKEIKKIREEEQKKAERRVKPRVIKIVKSEAHEDNTSMILYVILGLFLIVFIIIVVLIMKMRKQNKEQVRQDLHKDELPSNFYGETGVGTVFDIDMPDLSGSMVIGTSVLRVALSGKLDDLNITRVFKKLMDESKTGILTLFMDGVNPQTVDIQFNNGKISTAFCRTSSFQTKFKNQIIKELPGLKDKVDIIYNNSLENQERFCSILRSENIIEKNKLDSLILVQAKEIILSIFLWRTGTYEFKEIIEDDLDFDERNKLQLDVTGLIEEGIKRYKEWKYISKIISKASDRVDFLEGKKADLIANSTNKNLLEIIDLIDGKKTIKEIGTLSRFSDFKILKLLARLKEKEYIHFFD